MSWKHDQKKENFKHLKNKNKYEQLMEGEF